MQVIFKLKRFDLISYIKYRDRYVPKVSSLLLTTSLFVKFFSFPLCFLTAFLYFHGKVKQFRFLDEKSIEVTSQNQGRRKRGQEGPAMELGEGGGGASISFYPPPPRNLKRAPRKNCVENARNNITSLRSLRGARSRA